MLKLANLFPHILVASVSAFVFTPLVARLARRLGLMDVPGSAPHKQHDNPTPLCGGIVLVLALAITILALRPALDREVTGILLAGGMLVLWGLWDDRYSLPPLFKLASHFIVVGILIAFGVQVRLTVFNWLNLALTVLWVVGLINAFNFVDSMDGLALGLAGIATGFFMLVTVDSQQTQLAYLSAMIGGASIGLFYYNATPAKVFLGDSGAQLLGLLLATIGLAYDPIGLPQGVSWFTPILVLGVPIFDTVLVSVARFREGRPVYQAARDHTYHRLLGIGLDPTRAVLTMQMSAIGLGLISFIALGASVLTANAIFAGVFLVGIVGLGWLLKVQPGG